MYGNDLSSRSVTLKRGRSRLIRLASSSSASGSGAGDDEFERAGGRDHAFDPGIEAGRTRIGANPIAQIFGFADIEHVAAPIDHAVNAGLRRRQLGEAQDRVAPGGKRIVRPLGSDRGIHLFRWRKRWFLVLFDLDLGFDVFFRNAHAALPARRADADWCLPRT